MPNLFTSNDIVFVTGKGGVGKSTVAGALALALSRQGNRVLLAETDTYSALETAFDVELKGPDIFKTKHNVDLVNLRSKECLEHTLNRFVPGERISRAVVNNRIASTFFDAAPSVSEFVLLNRIFELTESVYDKAVVDLPASGHAVSFLNVPRTLERIMRGVGPVASRAKVIANEIEDASKTGIVAVCIPEEMPVSETIELSEKMESSLGRPLSLVTANMVHKSPLDDTFLPLLQEAYHEIAGSTDPSSLLLQHPSPIQRLLAGNELARRWHDRDKHYSTLLHQKLTCPVVEFPHKYESQPFQLLDTIASFLENVV